MLSLAASDPALAPRQRRGSAGWTGSIPLTALMAAAIALVVGLAYWDASRESEEALSDMAREQATLAKGVAAAVSARVRSLGSRAPSVGASELLSEVRAIESPERLRLFLARPGETGLFAGVGPVVHDAAVERALAHGADWVRLSRTEAPGFGLPQRTAMAGLATFDGPGGRWGVVIAATALRERDRELHALFRSIATVIVASGLILTFGGLAMRKQRKELILSRELAVSALERQREEQLVRIDKLATLAALSTGIAHEVSTPLGVIVGRAEQLLPKVAHDERATRGVQSIIEQGTRIDQVVRGFLNLARGESSTVELVRPEAVAHAAVELVGHRFEKASVGLHLRVDPGLPPVASDPRLVEQVLINLLLNACDACAGGGRVDLLVHADAERVGFVVTDDGSGISPEAAARATEPFFTTKPAGKGTGLGLAIAHEIVKHHGGSLTIEPRRSAKGTRASVELPVSRGLS